MPAERLSLCDVRRHMPADGSQLRRRHAVRPRPPSVNRVKQTHTRDESRFRLPPEDTDTAAAIS